MGICRYGVIPMAVAQKFPPPDCENSTKGTWGEEGRDCRKVWALDYEALGLNSSSHIY